MDSSVAGGFRVPRLDVVLKFRLVVATLTTSIQLFDIGVDKGVLLGRFSILLADVYAWILILACNLQSACLVFIFKRRTSLYVLLSLLL